MCTEDVAAVRCFSCQSNLCHQCDGNIHSTGETKSHNRQPLRDPKMIKKQHTVVPPHQVAYLLERQAGKVPHKWWHPPQEGSLESSQPTSPPSPADDSVKWKWSVDGGGKSKWVMDPAEGAAGGVTASEDDTMEWELDYLLSRASPPATLKPLLCAMMLSLAPGIIIAHMPIYGNTH